MRDGALAGRLADIVGAEGILFDEPMSAHTTFRIGGQADCLLQPSDGEQVRGLVRTLRESGTPYFIAGRGSNLLVSDDGYRGAIIQIGKRMGDISVSGTCMKAGAGASLAALSAAAQEHALTGLEFAGGIPGTLGGACAMNAGAYGGEMKQVLTGVTVLDENDEIVRIPAEELELSYRSSAILRRSLIVLAAELVLSEGDVSEIAATCADLRERRQTKQPLELPSAGSTFKRPEGHFAGKLIEEAKLRGYRVGGAQVSEKHCGFVVNTGGATASDVRQLIADVQRIVEEHSGIRLEPEVRFLGF